MKWGEPNDFAENSNRAPQGDPLWACDEGQSPDEEILDSSSFLIQGLVHDLKNHITITAHTMELAQMVNKMDQYREACGQLEEICDRARLALDQISQLVRRREEAARTLDLLGVTREVARRVRAWLPEADFLQVSIPALKGEKVRIRGFAHEIQELFLYLSGVQGPLESTQKRRSRLNMSMEAVKSPELNAAWGWSFQARGGTEPPLFWRALFEYQNATDGGDTPLPVHRAGRILEKHFARVEWEPNQGLLRVVWPGVKEGEQGADDPG